MEEYGIKHFSISLPKGANQDDIPVLLNHMSKTISHMGNIDIQDITFSNEIDEDGNDWPSFTVYYHTQKNKLSPLSRPVYESRLP